MSESDKEITVDVRLLTLNSPSAFKAYDKEVSEFERPLQAPIFWQ